MGNAKNAYGKPVYDDIYSFPQDLQDAADFADEFANIRRGTSAERQALPVGKQRAGMLFVETDTGAIYQAVGNGQWRVVVAPLTSYTPTITGLNLSHVTVSGKFEQIGSRVRGEVLITRNAASLPTALTVSFTLPVAPANTTATPRSLGVGTVYLQNTNVAYQAFTRYTGGNTAAINIAAVSGSAVAQGTNLGNTYPTTGAHGVGSFYQALFDYEVG